MGQSSSETAKDEGHGDLLPSFTAYFKKMKRGNKIISQEIIHSIELHLKKGNIQGASSVISDALKNIDSAPINIAVTGESGAGKSSFINALRRVGPEDKGAAAVGVVETTMTLLKAIRFMKKNYYFVRTKVDMDLDNEKKSKPRTFDREKILQKMRSYCESTFSQNNMDVPQIFLISNSDLSDYDFQVLMDSLINDLPAQKRHNFTLSISNITEAAIDRKDESIQQYIWLEAFKSVLLATLPAVGILRDDVEKLKVKLKRYQEIFGVDDESLEVMAKDLKVSVEQLKKIIKSPYLMETKKEETLREMILKYVEKFASATGGPLATGLYFKKTFYLHHVFLDTVTEDAKVLLRETYSKN
ncbi:Interferon-inducible GTPase 1 [Cricetulus griseus]|uniref:Interferon-inducible GTPase 1 n=1 Tax=Cricetulus griseus TaxID=10029 RepID=G3IAC5_CRIGR|nr:Interferon-inducible GTPase 1 [Cricetulus griseus]